jgi:hypothetical protein
MKKELCVNLVVYKDYTKMHGQQNVKFEIIIYTKLINFFNSNLETCALKFYSRLLPSLNYVYIKQVTALTLRFIYLTLDWVIWDLNRVTKTFDPSHYLFACNLVRFVGCFSS